MTRALRDPRWLGGLAVAVVFAVVCVLLAQWQLDRRVERAERNAAVLVNYDSSPVGLDEALGVSGGQDRSGALAREPSPQEQWTPVRLIGRYDPDDTVLVRNRPQSDSNGYQVAVPFDTTQPDGSTTRLLLVRGWVPAGVAAGGPTTVPDPPPGPVELVVRLRSGESPATRTAPTGQTYRLDLPALLGAAAQGSGAAARAPTWRSSPAPMAWSRPRTAPRQPGWPPWNARTSTPGRTSPTGCSGTCSHSRGWSSGWSSPGVTTWRLERWPETVTTGVRGGCTTPAGDEAPWSA